MTEKQTGRTGELEQAHTILSRVISVDGDASIVLLAEKAANMIKKTKEVKQEKLQFVTEMNERGEDMQYINSSVSGVFMTMLIKQYQEFLRENNAINYMEMCFRDNNKEEIVVTIAYKDGKTPHALRAEAEAERDELKLKLELANKKISLLTKEKNSAYDELCWARNVTAEEICQTKKS